MRGEERRDGVGAEDGRRGRGLEDASVRRAEEELVALAHDREPALVDKPVMRPADGGKVFEGRLARPARWTQCVTW